MHSEAPPLIAILAHPDDEFAIFPFLESARLGRVVHVVWLTNGGWGGQSTSRRRNESISVLRSLGIDERNMHFFGEEWGFDDGSLHSRLDELLPRLSDTMRQFLAGSELLIPAWEGGHPDHDACHLAGLALAAENKTPVTQFSLYHGAGLPGPFFRVLLPLPQNGEVEVLCTSWTMRMRYILLCMRYVSQWKSFLGLLPFFCIRMLHANAFVSQPINPVRTSERPHAGALLYERRGGPSWEAFALATRLYRWPNTRQIELGQESGHEE